MMDNIGIRLGAPTPLGLSLKEGGVNFALFSASSKEVKIGLFSPGIEKPIRVFPLHKTGDIWHIFIENVPPGSLYAYQCDGAEKWLLDPYAKFPATSRTWNQTPFKRGLARIQEPDPFDWENTSRPHIPREDLLIYEMHVRGFTQDASSGVKERGTFKGIVEKIPYLQELGINAIQIMPILEFDECHSKNIHPETLKPLPNYWGYNPLSFFGIKESYGGLNDLKTLVREMHKNKIEVFLDLVYNHTGEEGDKNYAISWRGIDNQTYYLLDEKGNYKDFTGCKNTVNVNHPIVQELILSSLRYLASELKIDGFRFDLASILTRGVDGTPLESPPILSAIRKDPLLSSLKLIAEPWDAVGLYQVGSFAKWGPWIEWNGKFRDIARSFIKGDAIAGEFASVLSGSEFLYEKTKTPTSGVNFSTAHDGFTLHDLVTYQNKYNRNNGEMNHDGSNMNCNWNCGVEGVSNLPEIKNLRERQMRNHLLALFLSQGIPMFPMGDEYGHTRLGNNNPYVQDNEINWFLWDTLEKNRDIFQFVKELIAFRKSHPALHRKTFLTDDDIDWHGIDGSGADWNSHFVSFSTKKSPKLFIAFNANSQPATVIFPKQTNWQLVIDTKEGWEIEKKGALLSSSFQMDPYSSLLCIELLLER